MLPWREPRLKERSDGSLDPYKILVSEVMLQQTQVSRVITKYDAFIGAFPTVKKLATASLKDVLAVWQGLGYNRRGKALHEAAKLLCERHGCRVPRERQALLALPGIGPYTAGAVRAFAYNEPDVFLETNIRTVLFHHFYADEGAPPHVADRELLQLIIGIQHEALRTGRSPRAFYAAMMDYGAALKEAGARLNNRSKHHTKQSRFAGSDRQIRGAILRALTQEACTKKKLEGMIDADRSRVGTQLERLAGEGFLRQQGRRWSLAP